MKLPKMTAAQFRALEAFAEENGVKWKQNLRDAWMTGKYRDYGAEEIASELQQLRNANFFGPSGLNRFRLPDEERCIAIWRRLLISEMTADEQAQIEATKVLLNTTGDRIYFKPDGTAKVWIIPSMCADDLGEYVEFQVSDGIPGERSGTHDFYSLKEAIAFHDKVISDGWQAAIMNPPKRSEVLKAS